MTTRFIFSIDTHSQMCKMTDKGANITMFISREDAKAIREAMDTFLKMSRPSRPSDEEITQDLGPITIEE